MDNFIFLFLKGNPTPIKLSHYNFNRNRDIEIYLSRKGLHFIGILSNEEREEFMKYTTTIPISIRRFD